MAIAQGLGLTTIAWAQGIGPLRRPLTRWLAKQTFRGCTAVSVRDRGSANLLSQWQIPWQLAPDPVWALASSPAPSLEPRPLPQVAVALRSHPLLTAPRLADLTQALIDFQRVTQTYLLLVPFQPSQDLALAETLQSQLPGVSEIIGFADPRQMKGLFQGVTMAIAMRYHGLIMAAAEGCRCFALSYDPKVSQLMQALELPGWELDQLPDSPQEITQAWLQVYHQETSLPWTQIQSFVTQAQLHQVLLKEQLRSQ
ncbi:polysaccharide pyruvyl transferase CsaB [Neosynechococcus sphagnicola]|uniref:polysaccharide pyruvyl transferase CsaB n=1 Tax=Neosynechococcus sphagnicola TaxID=1501145 RepID=UPI003084125F